MTSHLRAGGAEPLPLGDHESVTEEHAGRTALYYAALNGDLDQVRQLLEARSAACGGRTSASINEC
jgi:ankyrin repeat protein